MGGGSSGCSDASEGDDDDDEDEGRGVTTPLVEATVLPLTHFYYILVKSF